MPISVHCQPVPEPLAELFAGSVDVVASCGAVGCHFGASQAAKVLDEIARVVCPCGLALINAGPHGVGPDVLRDLAGARGLHCEGDARSCAVDRYRQLRLRKC